MSDLIRRRLTPILTNLRIKFNDVTQGLAIEAPTNDDMTVLNGYLHRLRGPVRRAEETLAEWNQIIAGLPDDQRADELAILDDFPPPREEPRDEAADPPIMELIERAHQQMEEARERLREWNHDRTHNEADRSLLGSENDLRRINMPDHGPLDESSSNRIPMGHIENQQEQGRRVDFNQLEQHSPSPPFGENSGQGRRQFTGTGYIANNGNGQLHGMGYTANNGNGQLNGMGYTASNGNGQQSPPFPAPLQSTLNANHPAATPATTGVSQLSTTFRPYKMEPPRFDGDPKEWTTFWMAFERAVHNQNIPDYEKHMCLLQSLVKDSEARRAIDAYPPSSDNYPIVVRILKDEFGDVNNLRERLISELLHLQVANNSLASLKGLREQIERICIQLEGPVTAHLIQDEVVCGIVRSKLPKQTLETLIGWEEEAGRVWSLKDLRTGLGRIVTRKQRLERTVTTLRPAETKEANPQPSPNRRQQHQDNRRRGPQETRAFAGVQQPARQSPSGPVAIYNQPATQQYQQQGPQQIGSGCSLCGEGQRHWPSRCHKYSTPELRRRRLQEQNRCFNCLREDHSARDCSSYKRCISCGDKHSFLVCTRPRSNQGTANQGQRPSPANQPRQPPQGTGPPAPAPPPRPPPPKRATGANNQPLGQTRRDFPSQPNETHGHVGIAETQGQMVNKGINEPQEPLSELVETTTALSLRPQVKPRAILMTRTVPVKAPNSGKESTAIVFFDSGSQTSYISNSMVQRLGLRRGATEDMRIHVLGGSQRAPLRFRSAVYAVDLKKTDDKWERVELNCIDQIAARMELHYWNDPVATHDTGDPRGTVEMHIGSPDILLGVRQFWDFFISRTPIDRGLHIIQTILGAVMGGQLTTNAPANSTSLMAINSSNQEQMPPSTAIEEFWSLETIGIKEDPAQDDDAVAEKTLATQIRREPDGRYIVRWPWRNPCPELPSNFAMAQRRLASTLRRLQLDPETLTKYHKDILDKLEPGIIEECHRNSNGREHYLPHHAVITPKKLRIVYDASAHPRGQACLNDCLYRGPVLLPDLAGLLIRFRSCRIPLLADVEKAFLMIGLEPEEREVCKFLWVREPTQPPNADNLVIYRFCRVAFGVVSSPFILAAVVRYHLELNPNNQKVVEFSNVYVDNVLMECETTEEAINKAKAAKAIFSKAKMNLREYVTNSTEVMETIEPDDRLDQPIAKVLGLRWDIQADAILFTLPDPEADDQPTRRKVLSLLAGIFDPLGLIGPCLLNAKLFFQQLWDDSHGWDGPLAPEETTNWGNILQHWRSHTLQIPRHASLGNTERMELHTFTDASKVAFAAAVYLRCLDRGFAQTMLIFSKVRLKPKKARESLTIPRMELLGVLLGVRATNFAKEQLKRPITTRHLWCDSQIALAWIRSSETQPVFVENRLREIRRHQELTFHYVNTEDNPADIASRGATPAELQEQKLWWNGPNWLTQDEEQWPKEICFNLNQEADEGDEPSPEANNTEQGAFVAITDEPLFKAENCSSWLTFLGAVILVLRFIKACRPAFGSLVSTRGAYTAEDYQLARKTAIRLDQKQHAKDFEAYRTFKDPDGLIRLRTRIDQNSGPDAPNIPILLSRHSNMTKLIIMDVHRKLKHAGVDWTLTEILLTYWFPQGRRTVKKVLKTCRRCRLMNAPKYALPTMPPLPADRVQRHRPFETIGLDYLGPTVARFCGEPVKVWIILITCLTTRAVYLEPTMDMTAVSFVNVLRRFISRRGSPQRILSDNGPQLVLTGKALKAMEPTREQLEEFAAQRAIEWRFIPQLSPWAGGIYERLVTLVKRCLQRTLGSRMLPYDEMCAFLAEAEASINSRPLTTVSDAEGAPIPIRPIDFIQHGAISHLITNNRDWDPDDRRLPPHEKLAALWKGTQEAIEACWKRWTKEYLLVLRERAGWTHKGPRLQTSSQPNVGDIVLVEEDYRPRNAWPLARVVELNGHPPNVRSAKLLMTNGRELVRPISRLCPLEANPVNEPIEEEFNPARGPAEDEIPVEQPPEAVGGPPQNKETPVEQQQEEEPAAVEQSSKVAAVEQEPNMTNQPAPTNAQKVAEFLAQQRDGNQPTGRAGETSRHGMQTRAKGRLATTIGLPAIITTICLLTVVAASTSAHAVSSCTECTINCTNKGVDLNSPMEIQKTEICCMGTCWARPSPHRFTFELPREILVNDYECHARFWHDSSQEFSATVNCPARNECDLLDCILCWDLITNPSCRPNIAMAVIGWGLAVTLSLLGILWTFLLRIHVGAWLLYKLIAFPMVWTIRGYYWARGKKKKTTTREMETRLRDGTKAIKRTATTVSNELNQLRQATVDRFRMPPRVPPQFLLPLALPFIVPLVMAGSETIAVVTQSESCQRGQDGLRCTIQSATTLTLLPVGQDSTLLLKDEHGLALGIFTLSFKALQMQCLQKSEAWLRSYRIHTLAVKRCPRAGSCRGDHCARVRTDSLVTELREANDYPGNTHCIDSSSFWHNECGLPASACLYYRWYAKPTSHEPYELLTCPTWDVKIQATVTLESSGGQSHSADIILHPGMTYHWGNISLTPLAFSLPPAPILGSRFLTNGRSVAIIDRLPNELHCPDESSARDFNCSLEAKACRDCIPDHEGGAVTCYCQDMDLEGIIENPAARLPLTTSKMHFRNDGPAIIAEHAYSPIQVHVQMKDLQLILEFRDSKCWMEPINMTGCYKCPTGAQLHYKCHTDWGSALAKVECADGTLFVSQCTPNGTERRVILPFDHSRVETECIVDCPAGETTFQLTADLHYIPLKRQFGHHQRSSASLDPMPDGKWKWPVDFSFDPFAIVRLWANLPLFMMFILMLIIGFAVIYVAVKMSPVYRAYKLAIWLFMNQPTRPTATHLAVAMAILPLAMGKPVSPFTDQLETGITMIRNEADRIIQESTDGILTGLAMFTTIAVTLSIITWLGACLRHRRHQRRFHGAYHPRSESGHENLAMTTISAIGGLSTLPTAHGHPSKTDWSPSSTAALVIMIIGLMANPMFRGLNRSRYIKWACLFITLAIAAWPTQNKEPSGNHVKDLAQIARSAPNLAYISRMKSCLWPISPLHSINRRQHSKLPMANQPNNPRAGWETPPPTEPNEDNRTGLESRPTVTPNASAPRRSPNRRTVRPPRRFAPPTAIDWSSPPRERSLLRHPDRPPSRRPIDTSQPPRPGHDEPFANNLFSRARDRQATAPVSQPPTARRPSPGAERDILNWQIHRANNSRQFEGQGGSNDVPQPSERTLAAQLHRDKLMGRSLPSPMSPPRMQPRDETSRRRHVAWSHQFDQMEPWDQRFIHGALSRFGRQMQAMPPIGGMEPEEFRDIQQSAGQLRRMMDNFWPQPTHGEHMAKAVACARLIIGQVDRYLANQPAEEEPMPVEPYEQATRLDVWAIRHHGQQWHRSRDTMDDVEHHLETALETDFYLRRVNGGLIDYHGVSPFGAHLEQVEPGLSVADFYRSRHNTDLRYPLWPCVRDRGGIRGTSRRSRQLQRITGRHPWRAGFIHDDLLPFETVEIVEILHRAPPRQSTRRIGARNQEQHFDGAPIFEGNQGHDHHQQQPQANPPQGANQRGRDRVFSIFAGPATAGRTVQWEAIRSDLMAFIEWGRTIHQRLFFRANGPWTSEAAHQHMLDVVESWGHAIDRMRRVPPLLERAQRTQQSSVPHTRHPRTNKQKAPRPNKPPAAHHSVGAPRIPNFKQRRQQTTPPAKAYRQPTAAESANFRRLVMEPEVANDFSTTSQQCRRRAIVNSRSRQYAIGSATNQASHRRTTVNSRSRQYAIGRRPRHNDCLSRRVPVPRRARPFDRPSRRWPTARDARHDGCPSK